MLNEGRRQEARGKRKGLKIGEHSDKNREDCWMIGGINL